MKMCIELYSIALRDLENPDNHPGERSQQSSHSASSSSNYAKCWQLHNTMKLTPKDNINLDSKLQSN